MTRDELKSTIQAALEAKLAEVEGQSFWRKCLSDSLIDVLLRVPEKGPTFAVQVEGDLFNDHEIVARISVDKGVTE